MDVVWSLKSLGVLVEPFPPPLQKEKQNAVSIAARKRHETWLQPLGTSSWHLHNETA